MGVARCCIQYSSQMGVEEVWQRICSLRRHTETIPFTTLSADNGESGLASGMVFTARTAIGPLGFDDRMVVEVLTPPEGSNPGYLVIVKLGRWLGGSTEATIVAEPDGGCRVRCVQRISSPLLPRWLEPLGSAVARLSYGAGLRRILGP